MTTFNTQAMTNNVTDINAKGVTLTGGTGPF
jgi:hypothetical protein